MSGRFAGIIFKEGEGGRRERGAKSCLGQHRHLARRGNHVILGQLP